METAYDMLASLARYLFVLIMLFIIAASAVLSAREGRMMRRAKRIARTNIRCIKIIEPNEMMGRRFYAAFPARMQGCLTIRERCA